MRVKHRPLGLEDWSANPRRSQERQTGHISWEPVAERLGDIVSSYLDPRVQTLSANDLRRSSGVVHPRSSAWDQLYLTLGGRLFIPVRIADPVSRP